MPEMFLVQKCRENKSFEAEQRVKNSKFIIQFAVNHRGYLFGRVQKCKIQYCGKAETNLNIRFNNNRKWLKDKVLTCELIHHFATHPNHELEKDLSITITEQLKSEEKRSSEEQREIWQGKLKTLAPHGLNARLS